MWTIKDRPRTNNESVILWELGFPKSQFSLYRFDSWRSAFRLFGYTVFLFSLLCCMVVLTGAEPLYLIYDIAEPAGSSSLYIPGAGFCGFWYQLGVLHRFQDLTRHEYYCFSSGCLSILFAMSNMTFQDAAVVSAGTQQKWLNGTISRYEVVSHFVASVIDVLEERQDVHELVSSLNVIVASLEHGVEIHKANNTSHLADLLVKTTYIPFITGNDFWYKDEASGKGYLDGGFSRTLHPECEHTIETPTDLSTVLHAFNPAMSLAQASMFYSDGRSVNHPLSVGGGAQTDGKTCVGKM